MELLAQRMRVCRQIGQYKRDHNVTVFQANRYNEILDKRSAQGALCGMNAEFIATIFESIHEESVRQQMDVVHQWKINCRYSNLQTAYKFEEGIIRLLLPKFSSKNTHKAEKRGEEQSMKFVIHFEIKK